MTSPSQTPEHVDVLIVGAGLSGIGAGCHLRTSCPGKTFAILEARDAIGGTWDLFRYPGIRSDSDMFTLGYPFRPWPEAEAIADGPSIRSYVQDTAREYGLEGTIRFHQRVVAADWSTEDARWTVEVERTDTHERLEVSCGFLFMCTAVAGAQVVAHVLPRQAGAAEHVVELLRGAVRVRRRGQHPGLDAHAVEHHALRAAGLAEALPGRRHLSLGDAVALDLVPVHDSHGGELLQSASRGPRPARSRGRARSRRRRGR